MPARGGRRSAERVTTRAAHPVAQALLGWMQLNTPLLRDLLEHEPAGEDAAMRAHLRFLARGLAEVAAPAARAGLEAFAGDMDGWFVRSEARLDEEMRRVGEAHAHEAGLQFGPAAGEDPTNRAVIERRVRMVAWSRVFLDGVEEALGPAGAGLADRSTHWMSDHQTLLADTIFAFDRRAKQAELARGGPDAIADPAVVNRIGQAATLQGSMRFLVEALAAGLDAR
jgi:hypothetical protein